MPGKVSYDPDYGLASFVGQGGFTQIRMTRREAEAVARAFGVKFEVLRMIGR